jgi:hypothetical protein
MPAQEKNWSVVNVRYDGKHASSTVWHPARSKRPVFRGWVTYDEELPSSLYALTTYVHPKVNPRYFQAQKHLLALQGRDHLWLAGLICTISTGTSAPLFQQSRLLGNSPQIQQI